MKLAIAAVITVVVTRGVGHAEPAAGELKLSYFYDGGAVPFFWMPALGALAVDRWVKPRKTPLYFDANDGGATRATWENPAWTLYIGAVGVAGGMIGSGDESRWYHVKGLAQALATSSLVVSALKPAFGRHRPDWAVDAAGGSSEETKSFPSGHTSGAFVVATYAALYLNSRVFDDNTSGWVKGAAYGGIFLGASLYASERIYHARHHLSDVMVGAVIGSASSYAMFRFQDHRFRHRDSEDSEEGGSGGWQITPSFSQESVTLGLSGDF